MFAKCIHYNQRRPSPIDIASLLPAPYDCPTQFSYICANGLTTSLWDGGFAPSSMQYRLYRVMFVVDKRNSYCDVEIRGFCHVLVSSFKGHMYNGYNTCSKTLWSSIVWYIETWAPIYIKMSFYHYRKSYFGNKTVVRSSYLHTGISILVRLCLCIESGPR